MTKLFALLFAAALVVGFSSAPTLTYAEGADEATTDTSTEPASDDPVEEAEEGE